MSAAPSGHTLSLPEPQRRAARLGAVLAWWTLGYLLVDTVILFLIKGNSQAMQAAWIQDLLGMVPPLAYLIGMRVARRRPTRNHPYGFLQSMDVAHLVAGAALLAFGGFLLFQSVMTLLRAERPDVGVFVVFGQDVWQGWIMIGFMFITLFPPLVLGRLKMKPAKMLHNKALFADAQMNKADWMAGLASIAGIAGIGLGIWWADAIAAIIISVDIIQDGYQNLRGSLTSMVEATPKTLGTSEPHPVPALVNARLAQLPWVREVGNRTREEGQYFYVDAYVVPHRANEVTAAELIDARELCQNAHWKIHDVSVIPVRELGPLLRVDRADLDDVERHSA